MEELRVASLSEKDLAQVQLLDELSGNDVAFMLDGEDYAWGVFLGDELVGYCTIGGADDPDMDYDNYEEWTDSSLCLSDVFVKEEYRGRGAALTMINEALQQANPDNDSVFITLLNDGLEHLYEQAGFRHIDDGTMVKAGEEPTQQRLRLFVDMDGTLAVFNPVVELEQLYEEGYFLNLTPHENVVAAVKDIIENHPEIEVHILSAYLTDSQYALQEKNDWLDRYLPEIDAAHRVFVPCGSDKKEGIPGSIRSSDFLLDDYTRNLNDWQPPARGIKLLNSINHTRGSWEHDRIRYDRNPTDLANGIVSIMQEEAHIYDERIERGVSMDTWERNIILDLARYDYIKGEDMANGLFRAYEPHSAASEPSAREVYEAEIERLNDEYGYNIRAMETYEGVLFIALSSEQFGYRYAPHEIAYNKVLTADQIAEYDSDTNGFLEHMYADLGNAGMQPPDFYGHSPSIGDAFLLLTPDGARCYAVDTIGFERELDISRIITPEQLRAAIFGMTVREEHELLERINTNAQILDNADYAEAVEAALGERLESLREEYTLVFYLADIRGVFLNEHDKLAVIHEWEEQNEVSQPLVAGQADGIYYVYEEAVPPGDAYNAEWLTAEINRRFERIAQELSRDKDVLYQYHASPVPLGERGQYNGFVQRYEREESGSGLIPRDVVYIGEPRDAINIANHLNAGSEYGEWLAEHFSLRQQLGDGILMGDAADKYLVSAESERMRDELDERIDRVTRAMEAAGYRLDEIDTTPTMGVFRGEGGIRVEFNSAREAEEWLDGVVFDDPEVSDAVEHIMHPERFVEQEAQEPDPFDYFYPDDIDLSPIEDILNGSLEYRYQMLDRMRSDCDYYLGNGNRNHRNLWAGSEREQIAFMKAIWQSFPENDRPEWLSIDDIVRYEREMSSVEQPHVRVAIESTEDYADPSFHQYLVDDEIQNEDGSYGRVVDYYRIVSINVNGRLDAYDDRIFTSPEAARAAIAGLSGVELVSYDELVNEAGANIAREARVEPTISFWVAESMEFKVLGEYHEGLTLQEALDIYEQIPAERLRAGKGIGFDLQDGSDYAGPFDLMHGDRVLEDDINEIAHYRYSPLVQQAIRDVKEELERRNNREQEEPTVDETPVREPDNTSPFIAAYYVVNDLQKQGQLDIVRYHNLEMALAAYAALPNDRMKALGIENTVQPYPGSLDFIQCRNGVDTLVRDYERVSGWDNPEIASAVSRISEVVDILQRSQGNDRNDYLWAVVNGAETREDVISTETMLKWSDANNELYDELMMALTYRNRELSREERGEEPTLREENQQRSVELREPPTTVEAIVERIGEIAAERQELYDQQYRYGYIAPPADLSRLHYEEQELNQVLEVVANYDVIAVRDELNGREIIGEERLGEEGISKYPIEVLIRAERVLINQDPELAERMSLGDTVSDAWEETHRNMTAQEAHAVYDLVFDRSIPLSELEARIQQSLDGDEPEQNENYRVFYDYDIEEAREFQRETGWRMIWGSDNQGLNGDSFVVYRSVEDLPPYLRDYAKKMESIGQSEYRYYYPELDLDGTADELFTQARNGYIESPEALGRLQEILTQENKESSALYVGVLREIAEDNGQRPYVFAQMKKDILDGVSPEEVTLREGLTLSVMLDEGDNVLLSLQEISEERDAAGSGAIPAYQFIRMTAGEFEETVNSIYAYGMVVQEREPEMERDSRNITIDGQACVIVDEWQSGSDTFVLGNALNDRDFYYAIVNNSSVNVFEYDARPTRERVEGDFVDLEAERDINRREAEASGFREEPLVDISDLAFDDEGYLHFTVEADGYELEGLYRVLDPANGEDMELVSIDYGDQHPIIERQWSRIEDYLYDASLDRFNELVDDRFEGRDQLIQDMAAIGYVYNEQESGTSRRVFNAENDGVSFANFEVAKNWLDVQREVVLNNPAQERPEPFAYATLQRDNVRYTFQYEADANQYRVQREHMLGLGSEVSSTRHSAEEGLSRFSELKENGFLEFRNANEVSWYATTDNNTGHPEVWEARDGYLIPINSHSAGVISEELIGMVVQELAERGHDASPLVVAEGMEDYNQIVHYNDEETIGSKESIATYVENTRFLENPIGNEGWYYNNPERGEVLAVYYNPDSTAGGQLVEMHFAYEDIRESAKIASTKEELYELLVGSATTYLIDIDTPEFKAGVEHYTEHAPDFKQEHNSSAIDKLIEIADKALEHEGIVALAGRVEDFLYRADIYGHNGDERLDSHDRTEFQARVLQAVESGEVQPYIEALTDIQDVYVNNDDGRFAWELREISDLVTSLENLEQYRQFYGREAEPNAIQPIREFTDEEGRVAEGERIPIVTSRYPGFADRAMVFAAVNDFEIANDLPENERTIHDGSYEDKVFLYSAYDRYVGMSHQNDLSIQPYMERLHAIADSEAGRYTNMMSLVAEVYYAQKNNLSSEQIDFILESAAKEQLPGEAMRNMRRGLERGLTEEQISITLGERESTKEYIVSFMLDGGSLETAKALKGCDPAQFYALSRPLNEGTISPEVAQAIIQTVNQIKNWNDADYSKQRSEGTGDSKPRFSFMDFDFFPEYLAEAAIKDNSITPEMITAIGTQFLEQRDTDNLRKFIEEHGGFQSFAPIHREEVTQERSDNMAMSNGDKAVTEGVALPTEKKDAKELLNDQLQQGIMNVLNSDNFKNWLDTSSKMFFNNYSFNNALLVWCQRPDATHTMGYEQWKEYGRNVAQGAQGIKIFVPVIAYEKKTGDLWNMIKSNLQSQLKADPSLQQASFRVGMSKLEITMNQNGLCGLRIDGREQGLKSQKDMESFIKHNIIGKVPMYFTVGTVFDAKDTVTPEYLWVKKGFTKAEMVKDDNGNPIKNRRGEYKIINTPERQAKFQPHLDMDVPQKDPTKMAILYDALKAVSERNGIHVYEKDREADDSLKGGADGYFARAFSDENPKGYIVMPTDLDPTKAVSVLLHEISHSELHGDLEKLAQSMGEDKIPSHMREIQAESVAYVVGKNFGIESDVSSFQYLAAYTKGFELQALSKSIEVIYSECKQLTAELKSELEVRGLNMDLSERDNTVMGKEAVDTLSKAYAGYALEQSDRITGIEKELPILAEQNKGKDTALTVLVEQSMNVQRQKEDVGLIISQVFSLEAASSLAAQHECIAKIESAKERIEGYKKDFSDLSVQFQEAAQKEQTLKDRFVADPVATIKDMGANMDYVKLGALSEVQVQYLAKSEYVSRELVPLLRNDPAKFEELAFERASQIDKVASKSGMFVEVSFCEQWTDKPIVSAGALMHPKVADSIVKQAEAQIRGLRAQAEAVGEYFPYSKCSLVIYQAEKGELTKAFSTRIDIGDGSQASIVDHLKQISSAREIVPVFDAATREKGAKDKVLFNEAAPAKGDAAKSHDAPRSERGMTREEWAKEIAATKEQMKSVGKNQPEQEKSKSRKSGREKGE